MNLIGKKFGKLYVIKKTNEKAKNNGEYKYMCVCDCEKKVLVRGSNLKCGNSKSCGCTGILKNCIGYGNENTNYEDGQFVIFSRVNPRGTIGG